MVTLRFFNLPPHNNDDSLADCGHSDQLQRRPTKYEGDIIARKYVRNTDELLLPHSCIQMGQLSDTTERSGAGSTALCALQDTEHGRVLLNGV